MHTKPEYSQLVTELMRMQKEIYDNEHIDRHAILGNMWANINPPGGMNMPHLHPNCFILRSVLCKISILNQVRLKIYGSKTRSTDVYAYKKRRRPW